jgi:hypothetical protein
MRILLHVSVDERQPLEAVSKLCREQFRIEKALSECVLAARSGGASWAMIGRASGSTKQAAWRRFARGPMSERFAEVVEPPRRPSGFAPLA